MFLGKLFFLNKPIAGLPIDEKYIAEVDEFTKESFQEQKDAILYLFDKGVTHFRFYTKEIHEYKQPDKVPIYELWRVEHRIGYVLLDYEPYIDEDGKFQKKRAYVWRFVGFGRTCFAPTPLELREKVKELIEYHKVDPKGFGYNSHPCYTKYYRYLEV